MGRSADAEPIAERIVGVARTSDAHALFAALDSLTSVFSRRTYPLEALRYGDQLLKVGATFLPVESTDWAALVLRHARLQFAVGDLEGAARQGARALRLARTNQALGVAEMASIHEDVAAMVGAVGASDSARVLLEHALELRHQSSGSDSFAIAITMRMLATHARGEADYARALVLIERAIEIAERHATAHDLRLLEFYNNHGAILGMLHDDVRANEAFRRCVQLASVVPGYPRLQLARYLNNVGLSEYMLERYANSRAYHDSALAIRQAIGDEGGVVESSRNLALVAARTGRTAEAESLLARCAAWRLGSRAGHALIEAQRFDLYLSAGRHADAAASLERESAFLSGITSPGHPSRIEASYRRALLYQASGEPALALATCLEADSLERSHFYLTARALSERQALDYQASRPEFLDLALSLPGRGQSARDRERLWNAILQGRGQILEEMGQRQRGLRALNDRGVQALLEKLATTRREYGRRFLSMVERTPSADSLLESSRREIEALETQLAKLNLPFREELRRNSVDFGAVRDALPGGSALVAFVGHQEIHAGASSSTRSYKACVLSSGVSSLIRLGSAPAIDSLVFAWREAVLRRSASQAELERQDQEVLGAGTRLRRAIWDPLRPMLQDARSVFLVPDGTLNQVNFAALPDSHGRFLVESDPLLHVLTSERDLVPGPHETERPEGVLVVASPDYDVTPRESVASTVASPASPGSSQTTFRGQSAECPDLASLRFSPLPAAMQEGERVVHAWKTGKPRGVAELLTGPAASEAALIAAVSRPRVVHLATHAFFLSNECDAAAASDRHRSAVRENPLRRCGLALAGANRRFQLAPGDEDGILTAEEVAALDLDGVDWVVLSACESGLGDIHAGEGVFGLRRAFAIAGARTTVMSLWPAEDNATSRWMDELYQARFVQGCSSAEAVRRASRKIVGRLRSRGESTNPASWGAFIAAGDWR